MHRPILLGYNNIYSTQTVGAYNTKTTCRKHADSIHMYSIIYVCMDVFIVIADDNNNNNNNNNKIIKVYFRPNTEGSEGPYSQSTSHDTCKHRYIK